MSQTTASWGSCEGGFLFGLTILGKYITCVSSDVDAAQVIQTDIGYVCQSE